jgi:hypothetical protein
MFGNNQFYPTPFEVILQMVGTIELNNKNVLEPEAGKGDIVDFCLESGAKVTACEYNQDLAKIIAGKCKFLKHNFFEVKPEEVSHIDYIIMNPPFNEADKHILHAWEIAPDGCEVIAICNTETLKNAYSTTRSRLVRAIEDYGHSTKLGNVFSTAERKTDVEVSLIHLFKPSSDSSFEGYFDEEEEVEEDQYNGIMPYNAVREAVQRYVTACKLFDEVAENAIKMNNLVGVFGVPKIALSVKEEDKDTTVTEFRKELQKKAWLWVFKKVNMEKYMTAKLKAEINNFVEKQQNVPFTQKNIYKMFEIVVGTHSSRMERAILEIFDNLTQHYHENRYCVEGWKTNSHYMVNQKFILEHVGHGDWHHGRPHVRYDGNSEKMEDLSKALCYLTGTKYSTSKTLYNFYNQSYETYIGEDGKKYNKKDEYQRDIPIYRDYGKWYDWGFFEVKLYKKNTLHAKFKDKAVWELFNRAVAKAKGFPLPESVKF